MQALSAYGMSIDDLRTTIASANVNTPNDLAPRPEGTHLRNRFKGMAQSASRFGDLEPGGLLCDFMAHPD